MEAHFQRRLSNSSVGRLSRLLGTATPRRSCIESTQSMKYSLKLSNFYLDDDENVKLGDFGFACQLASDYDRKRESCGTPNYIAPEAISGFGYSFSSDVWGIGVALFRMKFGICPF